MTLTAVRTTGIYCHPGCSANPLTTNTVSYPNAAAAEADGFRACFRCRPYRTHHTETWLEGPELVCRAVRLILDGWLDEGNEDRLAARLGVSGRHLRRLFAEHVGATPDQLARSRRAHFARRLLDDTDLSIGEIAYASGFGSSRQMGRVMQDVFRASPTELRAKRRRGDRLVADGGLDTRLTFRPPLRWDAMLDYLRRRAIPGVEHVGDDTYRRTIDVDGLTGALEVRRDEASDQLVATFHLPRWEGLIHLVARVRRLFDLDHDPTGPERTLGGDPLLRPWPTGLRVPGCWDPFEVGVRAILGQQVSVVGATTTTGKVVEAHGERVSGLEPIGLTARFPSPEALADADLPVPAQRANAVRAFAAATAADELVLDGSTPLDEMVDALCALPGIGPWTAHYLALRLGEADAFPAADLGVLKALGTTRATDAERRADVWRPYRAYATLRLWSSA